MFKAEDYQSFKELPADKVADFKPVSTEGDFVRETAIDDPETAFIESKELILAKPDRLEYTASDSKVISGREAKYFNNQGGYKYLYDRGGYGTDTVNKPAEYILHLTVNGEQSKAWVTRSFRDIFGKKLTAKLREAIEISMPEAVSVQEKVSGRGNKYYVVDPSDLIKWAVKARESLADKREEFVHQETQASQMKRVEEISSWFSLGQVCSEFAEIGIDEGLTWKFARLLAQKYPELTDRRINSEGDEVVVYSPELLWQLKEILL